MSKSRGGGCGKSVVDAKCEFFTEFRFFLDYAERKLKRHYGKQSQQAKEFKVATSQQFDGSFAYRLVSQLRNYGQHVNLPINALSLKSGDFNFLLGTTEDRLLVEVDRDELLNSGFDWRARDVRPQSHAHAGDKYASLPGGKDEDDVRL